MVKLVSLYVVFLKLAVSKNLSTTLRTYCIINYFYMYIKTFPISIANIQICALKNNKPITTQTAICIPMFTEALLTTDQREKQLNCPSTDEWI